MRRLKRRRVRKALSALLYDPALAGIDGGVLSYLVRERDSEALASAAPTLADVCGQLSFLLYACRVDDLPMSAGTWSNNSQFGTNAKGRELW
jgi:hypothetical protein